MLREMSDSFVFVAVVFETPHLPGPIRGSVTTANGSTHVFHRLEEKSRKTGAKPPTVLSEKSLRPMTRITFAKSLPPLRAGEIWQNRRAFLRQSQRFPPRDG